MARRTITSRPESSYFFFGAPSRSAFSFIRSSLMSHCCGMLAMLLTAYYRLSPEAKVRKRTVIMTGITYIIIFICGFGGMPR